MSCRSLIGLALGVVGLLVLTGGKAPSSIVDTKHNLSVTGKGEITAVNETRVCIFCHTSHGASAEGPLWNHRTSSRGGYRVYERASMVGEPEQPNGATKLCLSCHDGTIAVGAVRSHGVIAMRNVGSAGEIPDMRRSNLGTDLTGTHPVSVRMGQEMAMKNSNLRYPPSDPEGNVGTDANGYVQCTSCHDPHGSRSTQYPMWRKERYSDVCKVCHAY